MFTLADLSWAGIGFLWGRLSGPAGQREESGEPETSVST